MKKPFVFIAAIVAVVCLGAVVAVAKDTTRVPTSVKLHFTGEGGGKPGHPARRYFSGKVTAKKGCQKGRTVVLIRRTRMAPVGSDKSNARGKFKLVEHLFAYQVKHLLRDRRGHYRVVVEKRKITKDNGDKIVCGWKRSATVRLEDDG